MLEARASSDAAPPVAAVESSTPSVDEQAPAASPTFSSGEDAAATAPPAPGSSDNFVASSQREGLLSNGTAAYDEPPLQEPEPDTPLGEDVSRPQSAACCSAADSVADSDEDAPCLAEDVGEEAAWLARVEAARAALGAGDGRVPPTPSGAGRRAAGGTPRTSTAAAAPLDLGSLGGLVRAAAARRRDRDPAGTPRLACKRCVGAGGCRQFCAPRGAPRSVAELAHCANCVCAAHEHETEAEAAERAAAAAAMLAAHERAARRAAAALERRRAAVPPAPAAARAARVAAAARRRVEAAAAREALAETSLDALTQERRGACGGACGACPGFAVAFRPTDANDPSVMFFCSRCGCAVAEHAVDAAWRREEAARRAAEARAAAGGGARAARRRGARRRGAPR